MRQQEDNGNSTEYPPEERNKLALEIIQTMQRTYEPGQDRVITPENVYQAARTEGRPELEAFLDRLLLPGSGVEGLNHLDRCLEDLAAGRTVLFLPEHRGNFDVPSFHTLLLREHPRYHPILERLIYIAGRKLNESSEMIKMFTEKYARLVIVPKRDFPPVPPEETPEQTAAREAWEQNAARINRSAFRQLVRLKKSGHIFVLYPLGGRLKPGASTVPVRETVSYMSGFDRSYLISMEGNTLPPEPRMEDERPIPAKVVFRVGPPLDSKAFLAEQKAVFEREQAGGAVPGGGDAEQFTVNRIMQMLENLRLRGEYGMP